MSQVYAYGANQFVPMVERLVGRKVGKGTRAVPVVAVQSEGGGGSEMVGAVARAAENLQAWRAPPRPRKAV